MLQTIISEIVKRIWFIRNGFLWRSLCPSLHFNSRLERIHAPEGPRVPALSGAAAELGCFSGTAAPEPGNGAASRCSGGIYLRPLLFLLHGTGPSRTGSKSCQRIGRTSPTPDGDRGMARSPFAATRGLQKTSTGGGRFLVVPCSRSGIFSADHFTLYENKKRTCLQEQTVHIVPSQGARKTAIADRTLPVREGRRQ